MGKDMEENTELENFYIVDYNINVQAPKNWNNSLIKEYSKNLNNSLSPEEKIAYGKKSIPFNEDYTPSVYFTPKDINNVPKLDDAINKRLAFEKYKQEGKDTNWFSTLLRSGWNQSVDVAESSYTYLREAPVAIGAGVAWLENQDKLSPESREKWKRDLAKDVIDRMKAREKSASRFKYDINPYESKSAQGMGSLAPTLLATGVLGLSAILRGKGLKAALETNAPIASIFGLSSAENMYQNVLENGGSIVDAYIRSNLAGAAETGLEQFGLMSLNRFYKRKHFPWLILSSGASEGIQEGSQSIKDIAISGQYDTRTADQKLDDVFDSVWYGSLGGMTFTVGAAKGTNQFLHRRELVYNAAIEAGKSPEMALKLAQGAVPTEGQITEDATEFLNSLVNNVPDVSPEEMQKLAADYEKSIELSRGLDNEDAIAEVSFYDGLLKTLTDAGIQENEAKTQSLYWGRAVKNDYELAKENGVFQGSLSEFQKRWLNLNIANKPNVEAVKVGNQVIEKTAPMTEEEISQIWSERQAETRQMSDDEIDFFEGRPSRRLFSKSKEDIAEEDTQQKVFAKSVPALIREADKKIPDAKVKAGFGTAKGWLVTISKRLGLDIEGYKHIVDARSIKHIFNRHGKGNELTDNQIPVTDKDIENIPNIVNSPDYLVYGTKTDNGRDGVGYLKTIPDGTTYYVEEIRDKEKQLAAKTMYKIEGVSSDNLVKAIGEPTSETTPSAVRLIDKLKKSTVVPAFTQNIASGNIKVNNKLFSKENNQLPPAAYDEQGKADINTPEFKRWSGNSEVVTSEQAKDYKFETGKAVTVEGFHGSDRLFNAFKTRRSRGLNSLGRGFYFANNKQATHFWGDNLYEVYISFKNPFVTEQDWFYKDELENIAKFLGVDKDLLSRDNVNEYLANAGYDGIISKKNGDYVAFNPNQIKSVYNRGTFSPESNNIYYSNSDEKVYGTYDPSEHLIELFKDARPDTLTHELSHHFFQNHFRAAQEFGFSDYDRGVFKWLSRQGKREITNFDDMQNQDWENLTEAFIRYLNTGNSPTIATRGLFEKAKEWILDVFNDNREYANSEVKDFFDSLVSREGEIPNIDNIIKNKADFEEAIQQALRGESATFRGQNRKSIANLRKGLHTRVRRPGMTLDKELKSLGYKVDVLNGRLVDDAGIVEDNRVAEIFMDLGLLDNIDTETYTQTEALSSKIQNILQDAEHIYSRREGEIQRQRDAAIQNQAKIQSFIDDLLKDNKLGLKTIEDLDTLLANVLSKSDDTDIVKVNRNAIKYLQAKLNEMNKEYRNTIKQLYQGEKVRNETRYELQDRLRKFIKNLPISGDRKVSLDGNIQRVKDADSFAKVFNDVRKRARDYIEYEEKQLNRRNIEEVIKSTKPLKFRKQRYTFEDNKFFQEMRDILKLSQGEAAKAFEELSNNIFSDENMAQGVSEYDRVRNMLYNYKINGADTSLALLQDLASSLEQLKNEAVDKRLQEDELKAAVKTENKNELLDAIETLKKSNKFAKGIAQIGTIRSTMNEMFGKKLSDKWNLETAFEKVNIFLRNNSAKVMQQAMNIYGSKSKGDFLQLMQNKSKEEFELRDNDGDYQRMSVLDILDIYIQMKDDNTRANFYAAYETFDDTMPTDRASLRAAIESMSDEQLKEHLLTDNLGKLLSHLSQKDMEFADMLQQEVADMWEIENDIFVKMYGIDLPHNKNYFPRTSKNTLDYDVMENLRVRSQTPSFFKERASTVTPRPKNVWTKYQEYITNVGYVQNVALKYKDLHALMTDKAIRGKIVEKYGDDFYRAFMANLDDLSIKGAVKTYNEVGRLMQTLLNNLVSGTVALNVPMAIKQLPAALNYSVNMPKKEFIKNFIYAATHPAEVKKTMDSYVGDFLKTRFEQGSQSDAIGRAMAEANNLVNSKYSLAGFTHNWKNIATTPIRFADIFAIYWGGYAKLKYNIDRGVSREKIIEDFIDETLSNQAAGNPATLAKYQREQTLRFFTAFRNVPAQYMRLITTTATQWRRGEISDARFYSNIANYVFIQPALYIALGWMIKSFLYGDDDDDWYDGMMTEIALSPIAGLPIVADLARFGVDKIESAVTGKSPEPWDALQVFGVDSLNRLMWKSVKKDKTSWDWAEILGAIVDVGTGAGLGTAVRTVKKIAD